MKVLLILVDGMRPDALPGVPEAEAMKARASYAMDAQTVFPSVTLPCHMSLFHSVDPARHGITTNTYMAQVRPIRGLCEVLKANELRSGMFFNWEELRDLSRPGSLADAYFRAGHDFTYEVANEMVTDEAIRALKEDDLDFAFLYLGWVDEAGLGFGWMGEEYDRSVRASWKDIDRVIKSLDGEWTVIVTADHGGHERSHGTTMPEDMTIPMFFEGKDFKPGEKLENVSIKDIAPTVAKLLGCKPDRDWEGKSIL